ncbi:MAG: energy-coupling factor ABC transporter permease [Candidatus Bathyarchaeia archaeon]
MHIPDGFLDLSTAAITYIIFLLYGFYALRRARISLSGEKISLISVLAAGIFAAQMLNWPIPGGTSLHFVGGALSGILLGPWLGFLPMLLVLLVQCLIFHDGGITALGANVLNMAVIAVMVGYLSYRATVQIFGARESVRAIGGFLGGWLGITLAGAACGLEIGYSPSFPYGVAVTVPIMAGWHLILGIIEGAVTALTIVYISHRAPHLILSEARRRKE